LSSWSWSGPRWARLLLSPNAEKRDAEVFLLLYSPLWMAAAGTVMATGYGGQWGDVPLMAFGLAMQAGNLLGLALYRPSTADARVPPSQQPPWWARFGVQLHVWLALFAYCANWAFTRYFYEVLGMSYGFAVTWRWNHVPAFLYPLTVAYFGTYYVLVTVALRAGRAVWPRAPPVVRAFVYAGATLAVAFFETLLNANPLIRDVFCYEDLPFMLWFGTLMYGSYFAIAGWWWLRMAEQPGARLAWGAVLGSFFACFAVMAAANALFAHAIAPWVTTVRWGRIGLHVVGESCLQRV
jgi:cycloeucalenol cycloisomerase